ncbi:hypothetical protein MBT84_33545 [Streptomyces sp. MBT84]|nr:hypothetical protein [Streptomyces sp. MBT84]
MGDPLPHGHHGPRALVTEHRGHRNPHGAVGQGQIGVADPGGGQPDPDPAGPRLGQLDAGDLQRGTDGGQDSGTDHLAQRSWNWRDLVWRYSASPCAPSSRPTPDCL